MPQKWRKKPVVIEAVQVDVGRYDELMEFVGESMGVDEQGNHYIKTLEGNMYFSLYDYIIKGVKGEFYPCKPDIFHETYERDLVWDENI